MSDYLDEQDFYEVCQTYRHAQDVLPLAPGLLTAAEAFDALKEYIRQNLQTATWAERELAEIVRIVQPREHEDEITHAIRVSTIRRLIEADEERYLNLMGRVK